MTRQKDPRRRTLRLAIGGVLLSATLTGCSVNYEVPVNRTPAPPVIVYIPAAPTPTKASVMPSEAPPPETSPPSATPAPKTSPRPSYGLSGDVGTASVSGGYATWYRSGNMFHAAAGPFLRDWFGPDWRGRKVVVWYGNRWIRVILTDSCWCIDRHGRPTFLDLDYRAFDWLSDPSRGVLRVTLEAR